MCAEGTVQGEGFSRLGQLLSLPGSPRVRVLSNFGLPFSCESVHGRQKGLEGRGKWPPPRQPLWWGRRALLEGEGREGSPRCSPPCPLSLCPCSWDRCTSAETVASRQPRAAARLGSGCLVHTEALVGWRWPWAAWGAGRQPAHTALRDCR